MLRCAEGVVSPGKAHEEPRRVNAGLAGEANQTACEGFIAVGSFGGDHEHRIVECRDYLLEGF
jgi:hypothetical protein